MDAQCTDKNTCEGIKKHRCPRGARRNKKTRKCVTTKKHISPKLTSNNKDFTKLKNTTPISRRNKEAHLLKLIMGSPRKSATRKSFSPDINRRLIDMTSQITSAAPIAECNSPNIMNPTYFTQRQTPRTKKKHDFLVNIGTSVHTNCVKFNIKKAIAVLLDNFSKSKHLNCNNIIAPKQISGNCWFNTMFIIFFVSDKGRKFFRFFRQLMIEGKTSSGKKIKPALHKAFFLFNLAIEACYNQGNKQITRRLATSLDTNNIIIKIWKSIPKKHRGSGIVKIDDSSNPLKFYKDLMAYLSNNDVSMMVMRDDDIGLGEHFSQKNVSDFFIHNGNWNGAMDLFVLIIHDEAPTRGADNPSRKMRKETEYTLVAGGNRIKYVLDSAIIRDTLGEHFCATLTCNKVEFRFEGSSYSRLTPFPWKEKINEDVEWTFDGTVWRGGSDGGDLKRKRGDPIKWNFKNGYQMLFYYRI